MEMGVMDRLILLNTLPKQGDIVTVRVVRELREKLELAADEIAALGLKPGDPINSKTLEAAEKKELEFGKVEQGIIKNALGNLDKEKKLTEEHISLWDMFC